MRLDLRLPLSLCAASIVAACGGSGSGYGTPAAPVNQSAAVVTVPGLSSTANFSFDLGTVVDGKYYLTDRNNKAVDVVDVVSLQITQIKGTGANAFTGVAAGGNAVSGPNGINDITGTGMMFVGDVDSVKVIDKASGTVTGSIALTKTGFRADEGCYDADHHLYMVATPDAATPFASIINANTLKVVATINWVDVDGSTPAGGNEQCQYDAGQQSFVVNNDGTIANPHGEMEVIPVSSIQAIPAGGTVNVFSLANVKRFPLGICDPTGLVLGPGTDAMAECRQGDAGAALTTLIVNRTNGAILSTVPFGGGDQVAFDAGSNRYYIAASRWHASGKNDLGGGCSAANPCTPTLGIVDASTRKLVKTYATGNNAHSVAVDPMKTQVFVPFSSAASPAGCSTCAANGFTTPGISVFAL